MNSNQYIQDLARIQQQTVELHQIIHEEKFGRYEQAALITLLDFSEVLNETARKDKRNTLFLSLICIFYYLLDVKVTAIASGIKIGDPSGFLPLLLLISATYFSISFLVRVLSSIKPLMVRTVVYDIHKADGLDGETKQHLERNGFYHLHAKVVLYEALTIHKLTKKYLKGNYLFPGGIDERPEFLYKTDQKAGEKSASNHVYYPLVKTNIWKGFFRPAILLELFLPWIVNVVAIINYLFNENIFL